MSYVSFCFSSPFCFFTLLTPRFWDIFQINCFCCWQRHFSIFVFIGCRKSVVCLLAKTFEHFSFLSFAVCCLLIFTLKISGWLHFGENREKQLKNIQHFGVELLTKTFEHFLLNIFCLLFAFRKFVFLVWLLSFCWLLLTKTFEQHCLQQLLPNLSHSKSYLNQSKKVKV